MTRFLLGVVVGAAATAAYLTRRTAAMPRRATMGRVDELSSAAQNVVADPPLNAGDGTPSRTAATDI